jgi:hypothetical protein
MSNGNEPPKKRRCSTCGESKPLTNFYKDKRARDGYGYSCKPCAKARARANYFENHEERKSRNRLYGKRPEVRERTRDQRLQAKYGISSADYDRMLTRQGGVCAICKQDRRDSRDREMPVDHDHATKAVRGILCDHCNRIIGLFNDDPDTILAAIEYLKTWSKDQP